jgi:hypothetical protein
MNEKFITQGDVDIRGCLSLSLLRGANTLLLSAKYKKISDLYVHISIRLQFSFARQFWHAHPILWRQMT